MLKRSLWMNFIRTNLSGGHKSDFQYCMSWKLIYLSSWLTFALQFSAKRFPRHFAWNFFFLLYVRSSLMVIKQWPEKLTEKKLFVLHFLNWINYCDSLDIFFFSSVYVFWASTLWWVKFSVNEMGFIMVSSILYNINRKPSVWVKIW